MKIRNIIWIYPFIVLGILFLLMSSCKKEDNSITYYFETGTVTDVEGNIYVTVKIGNQWWMAENLKTTKYNDNTAIPLVTDSAVWINLNTPGYCWYNKDAATYKNTYGALYNWFTLNTGKLAPTGWHIPTDAEWTILTDYLGGVNVAGDKMKSTGTIEAGTGLWHSPCLATNESGFTAIPAGCRNRYGTFSEIGYFGYWWSSSESHTYYAWARSLYFYDSYVYRSYYNNKNDGYFVRCVRD